MQYPWRSGTCGVATAAFVGLAILSSHIMRTDMGYAIALAAALATSAAGCISWLRHHEELLRNRIAQAASAAGGLMILIVGIVMLINAHVPSNIINQTSMDALSIVMPLAVLVSLIGGLAQFRLRTATLITLLLSSSLLNLWLAVEHGPLWLRLIISLLGCCAAGFSAVLCHRYLHHAHAGFYLIVAALSISSVVGVALALNIFGLRIAAWGLFLAAVCATSAGFVATLTKGHQGPSVAQ